MKIETKDIIRIANDLDIAINNNEKFAVPILAARATKGALNNPGDETLRMISNVLSKMSESGKLFISKGEFNEIYTKFATKNTKAKEYFISELNKVACELKDRELAGKEVKEIDLYEGADQTISNAFSSLWDDNGKIAKTAEYKSYNPKVAEKANYITNLQFAKLGVNTKDVKTFAGTDKFILCDAVCETPNGDSHILVPVEISTSGVLIPVMFINKHGFVDLNENTLEKHFKEFAGKNLNINSEKIFELLHTASNIETLDEFGLQVLAAQNAVKQNRKIDTSVGDLLSIVGQEDFIKSASTGDYSGYNNVLNKLCEASEAKASKEDVNLFGSYLESAKGIAELTFSKSVVENGRNIIASKIASFGYNPQITITACDDNSITYAIAIATKNGPLGFEVISEVENEKPLVPYIMAVSDKAYDFTVEGLQSAINDKVNNTKILAVISPLYDLKSSEIVAIVKQASSTGDYQIAEEALNILSEKADFESYASALNEYMKGLNGEISKQACKSDCKCTRIIKASNRGNPLCGHLNLPLDQVYQDNNGNCIPKYRKNMNDTYEGMLFNTSKIFS
jgi:hypothetical protein